MSLAAMELDPDVPLRLREDIAMIRRNIDLETKLIDDLLDLSRITSGKLVMRAEPTRVHDLLRHIVTSCRSDALEKQLSTRLDTQAGDDLVSADPARLQQVLWNIIRNALKFTPADGRIHISTSTPLPGRLRVQVSDSGIGIPPEKLSRIFDAFEQLEPVTARHFGGLGLGLAIAKAVVELHGGSIEAHSEGIGRGTTIVIDLPTIGAKAGAHSRGSDDPFGAAAAAHHGQPRMRARVLLVEDHPDTAKVLGRLLRVSGCSVSTAASAAAAMDLAAKESFDIVVSDIGLPDSTGYELMRELRTRHGMKGVALSGYGMDEDVQRSRAAGFSDHLVKPINVDTLRSVIVNLCDQAPVASR
jgi:CheY-like chemotaxis protein